MPSLNFGTLPPVGDLPDTVWLFIAKATGAVAGSAISIAYMLPAGKREAALRFVIGVIVGLVFGTAVGVKIASDLGIADRLSAFETTLSGAAAASLCAWWGLGVLARVAARLQANPDSIEKSSKRSKS